MRLEAKLRIEARMLRGIGIAVLFMAVKMSAREWPQYRGPDHDGASSDRIIKQWTGPVTNAVWRVFLGNGLSSLTAQGGRVFTQATRLSNGTNFDTCVALNLTNGVELWARPLEPASYPDGGVGYDDGPRSTPVVEGGAVYVLTSYLKLFRLNATNGAVVWQRDLRTLYSASVIGWQNSASPVVADGFIFVNANAGTSRVMAFRTSDGSLVWRAENEGMTHATPVLATIHGTRQLILATQSGLLALNPLTGQRYWRFSYPFSYSTSIGASPAVWEDMVFATGAHSYGMGSLAVSVAETNGTWTATEAWRTNTIASHWMTPVAKDGFLYGMFGIQTFDSANAQLKCLDFRTGAQKWSTNGFGRGGTLLVDGHLLGLTERGNLILATLNTNAYTEVARFNAIPRFDQNTNKCWNVPAVCNGQVLVRSTANVACFNLALEDLKVAGPHLTPGQPFRFAISTPSGTSVATNRLAQVTIRTSSSLDVPVGAWSVLTNKPRLTNGQVEIELPAVTNDGARFFIITEPQ